MLGQVGNCLDGSSLFACVVADGGFDHRLKLLVFVRSLLIEKSHIAENCGSGRAAKLPAEKVNKRLKPALIFHGCRLKPAFWTTFCALRNRRKTFFAFNKSHRLSFLTPMPLGKRDLHGTVQSFMA